MVVEGQPIRKRTGCIALSDDQYFLQSNLNLMRYKKLMEAENPDSTAYKRLKKAYTAQEVRMRSKLQARREKQKLSCFDDAMQAILDHVSKVVDQATQQKIASELRQKDPSLQLNFGERARLSK